MCNPSLQCAIPLTSSDEVHDLNLVSLPDHRRLVGLALDDDEIAFDGHAARVDRVVRQEGAHGHGAGEFNGLAVEPNRQGLKKRR